MARMFIVDESVIEEKSKCRHCNWEVEKLYAMAESQEDANDLYLSDDAGLCGGCMCDLLQEFPYTIQYPPRNGN